MRGSLGAFLLLAAAGAYAEYLRLAARPEWDNVVVGDADGVGSGGSGLLESLGGGGELLQAGAGPGFSGSGSASGSGAFITVIS